MTAIKSLRSITLELPPSCVEFCPDHHQYAVIGTYNLEKDDHEVAGGEGQQKSQQRNGSLILIEVNGDDVTLLHTLPTPSAILDVHFLHGASEATLGLATSTGSIGIYKLVVPSGKEARLVHVRTLEYFDQDVLVTAFSWHPDGHTFGATLSSGAVCLGDIEMNSDTEIRNVELMNHELEAWTLAFTPDGSGVLSGGDDCALKFVELPQNPIDAHERLISEPTYAPWRKSPWTDKKVHGAGVTAILPLHWDEAGTLLVTGSYDDHIRLIYAPSIGRRQVLSELNLEGGVWRLKVLSRKPPAQDLPTLQLGDTVSRPQEVLLLVSCMHAGARIVKLFREDDEWRFEVVAKFDEHKSMNYGSDCQPELNEQGQRTFVSTSFYDRLLCLWRH